MLIRATTPLVMFRKTVDTYGKLIRMRKESKLPL